MTTATNGSTPTTRVAAAAERESPDAGRAARGRAEGCAAVR